MRCSLDDVLASAAADQGRFDAYMVQRKTDVDASHLRHSMHLSKIKEKGGTASIEFQNKRLRVLPHVFQAKLAPGEAQVDVKHRPQRYVNMITDSLRLACDGDPGMAVAKSGAWHTFDVSSVVGLQHNQFSDAMAAVGQLCTTDPEHHAVLCILPMATGTITGNQAIKSRRYVEDQVMKCRLEVAFCSSFAFGDTGHEGDKRPRCCWAIVAVSDAKCNVFLNTNICTGKTSQMTAPLLRPKDMVTFKSESEDAVPEAVQSTDYLTRGSKRVSEKDRIRQRGVGVTKAMLADLLTGHTMEHNQACLIIEYHPTPGTEWLCATRDVFFDDVTSSK